MRMAPHVLRRHLALPYGLPGVLPMLERVGPCGANVSCLHDGSHRAWVPRRPCPERCCCSVLSFYPDTSG